MEACSAARESERLVGPQTMLPDLLRAYPHLRPILDRYGLKGCGGEWGPAETLGFFARAHGVPEARLIRELQEARDAQTALPAPAFRPGPADTIYRPFFKGSIAVVLTAGATWGALLLLKIGYSFEFSVNSVSSVNAHGHAMIFGWVGLMVMGFAYQAFPRFKHTELVAPRWALASFWLMCSGILLRCVGEPFHDHSPWFLAAAFAASVLETTAIVLFVGILLKTFARSGKPYAFYDRYVLAGLAFFLIQALWDTALLWLTTTAPSEDLLIRRVAAYQAPLRDLQIHGFATFMILGVAQRFLPTIYGFREPNERLARALFLPLLAAVAGEAVFFVLMQRTESRALFGAALYLSMLSFAAIMVLFARNLGIFRACSESDRSVKFVRAAFVWLLISAAMMALMPVYLFWYGSTHASPFSHAYYGAVRHAVTVGFISMMMLGVSAKIVPTLMGVEPKRLGELWPTFVLVCTGCTLRVVFQVLSDVPALAHFAFPVAGISGVLEVLGIALWGIHLWRVMDGRYAEGPALRSPAAFHLDERTRVGTVLELYPQTLPVFVAFGFELLTNPFLRKTLARNVSLAQAAKIKQVDVAQLLSALAKAIGGESARLAP